MNGTQIKLDNKINISDRDFNTQYFSSILTSLFCVTLM